MDHSLNKYLYFFFSLDNPLYYVIFFVVLIVLMIRFIFIKIYLPKKETLEQEIENTNTKVMALFAQLDPNPLIRIDKDYNLVHFNESAKELIEYLKTEYSGSLRSFFKFNLEEKIENNMSEAFDAYIGDRYFHITFKGIKNLGIGQVYFSDLTDRKKYENKLKESERKLRELSFYLQDSLEEEKQRIGMELHDSIGQNLMLLKMKLNNSLEKDNFINSYNDISETVNVTINEIRSIIFNLKPRVLEDIGLSAAIDQLVEHLNKLTSIEGSFNVEGVPVRLSSKHELFLFRILQEAINNILKHSRATEYHIQMYYLPEVLKIVVTDDGIGINTDAIESGRYKGNGLFNIKERINSINGRMFIESTEQEGSMILLEVPIWKE